MDYRSDWALQRAKAVIESEYAMVGISERLNETLQLMEKVLPQFYLGLPTFAASHKESSES